MNFHACFLSLASLLLAACSTTVKHGDPFVLEKKSRVYLRDGTKIPARRVALEAGTLLVIGKRSGEESRIPLGRVDRVVEIDRVFAMSRAAAVGAGIGAVVFGTVGYRADPGGCPEMEEDEGPCLNITLPRPLNALFGAIGGGLFIGAPIGAVYGFLRGRGESWTFEIPAHSDSIRASAFEPWSNER